MVCHRTTQSWAKKIPTLRLRRRRLAAAAGSSAELLQLRRRAGKSMKSWAPINLNVGLVVGVLFVLLTYLVLSQQAASSGLNGTESFHTAHWPSQRADHEMRTTVKFLLVACWYAVAATVAQWIMDKHLTTNGPGETCKRFHHKVSSVAILLSVLHKLTNSSCLLLNLQSSLQMCSRPRKNRRLKSQVDQVSIRIVSIKFASFVQTPYSGERWGFTRSRDGNGY